MPAGQLCTWGHTARPHPHACGGCCQAGSRSPRRPRPAPPASRAARGWSKGGEFGKLVNRKKAWPPPLPSPAASPSRRPQPAPRSWRQRPGDVQGGCASINFKGMRGCTYTLRLQRLASRPARPWLPRRAPGSQSRSPARSGAKCGRAAGPGRPRRTALHLLPRATCRPGAASCAPG